MKYPVRVQVGKTNSNALILIDQPRRLLDIMGLFRLKKGQTNRRYLNKGYLRFVFPTRKLAKAYQALVEEYCSPVVNTKRYRRAG